jgi:hypothetical protein
MMQTKPSKKTLTRGMAAGAEDKRHRDPSLEVLDQQAEEK